jgi:demethylmenaquinone methyltransferase/2-methoxy-6-polyprenyl-1,4-benzoquinol methylase
MDAARTEGSDAGVLLPHEPLAEYYPGQAQKDAFVQEMFDSTAQDYDRMERILALGTGPWYRGQALSRAGLRPGMRVVDVGVGTGLVASEAVKLTGDPSLVTGVDPSPGMLAQAQVPAGVTLLEGRAEALPFADASFDFLSMGYALRHIGDLAAAFREFHRVLRPGGRFCLLEITAPRTRWGRTLMRWYMRSLVPSLALLVGRARNTRRLWRYYWDTIEACIPPQQVVEALQAAGFADVRVVHDVKGMEILSEFQGTRAD